MSIYKYVVDERIDILQDRHIRFTQPSEFNDPFELNPFFTAMTDDIFVEELLKGPGWDEENFEKLLEEAFIKKTKEYIGVPLSYGLVREQAKIFIKQFLPLGKIMFRNILKLNGRETRNAILSKMRVAIDKTVGILCFTEMSDNLIMWAHYAQSHEGFVIEFDEKHKFFDQRSKTKELRGHLKKVQYLKERPQMMFYDSRISEEENLDNWISKFIWNKSDYWEYEQEWRMIEVLSDCKNKIQKDFHDIYLFPIPLDCITGIVLGCRMPEEKRNIFIELLKSDKLYSHIKLKQAVIDDRNYQLNIV